MQARRALLEGIDTKPAEQQVEGAIAAVAAYPSNSVSAYLLLKHLPSGGWTRTQKR